MNAYVKENLASALIGANTFQVRRTPIRVGLFDDEEWRKLQKRPRITESDANAVIAAVPEAVAVSLQSGWPTPIADIVWRTKTQADVVILGVTPPYQIVQDYVFASGRPISDIDVRAHNSVAVIGADVQPDHGVELNRSGRQYQNRSGNVAAENAANFEAVQIREHQVKHDQVHGARSGYGRAPCRCVTDLKTSGAQNS